MGYIRIIERTIIGLFKGDDARGLDYSSYRVLGRNAEDRGKWDFVAPSSRLLK